MLEKQTGNNATWYWLGRVLETRRFGVCYIHTNQRSLHGYRLAHVLDGITFSYRSYGRSVIGGGHKYKAYAYRGDKVVSTKEIKQLIYDIQIICKKEAV